MNNITHEDRLYKLFNNVNDWLKFAEAKNFGLLALNAAIVFGFSQTNFSEESVLEKAGLYFFCPFAFISFIVTLISLFPILSKIEKGEHVKTWISKLSNWIDTETRFENIHFYGYLKGIDESEFESQFLSKIGSSDAFTEFEKELTIQILYNSRITSLKYQLFKIGAFFFFLGAIFFPISLGIIKCFL